MNFKDFKKSQDKVKEALAQSEAKAPVIVDDRIWSLTSDSAGNASAVIRFLPQKDPRKTPILKVFRHSVNENGKWLIDECPVTVNDKCPICEYSASIWASNEPLARKFWRKKTYIANILIVDDPAKPENNGKVKIFKFGKQIYDMIAKVCNNEDESERLDIFSFDEGHNLKLNQIQVDKYNNYDKKSSFSIKPTPICGGNEEEQEQVYNSIHDLDEFINKEKFKSFEDLEKKLHKFMNIPSGLPSTIEDKMKTVVEPPKPKLDKDDDTDTLGIDDDDFSKLLGDDDDIPY